MEENTGVSSYGQEYNRTPVEKTNWKEVIGEKEAENKAKEELAKLEVPSVYGAAADPVGLKLNDAESVNPEI